MKTTIEVVGSDTAVGRNLLYVVIKKEDQAIKNGLFRLQHPGNLEVDKWNESMVKRNIEGDAADLSVSTTNRTKRFFSECVFPVEEAHTDIEKELVSEYGLNTAGKINPNTIAPNVYGVWQKLQTRFFSGDLWDSLPESTDEPNVQTVENKSKGNSKK